MSLKIQPHLLNVDYESSSFVIPSPKKHHPETMD